MTFSLAWTLMIVCTSIYIYIYVCVCVFVTCNYVSADRGKGWPVVACPSRALVVLYRMLTIFACYVLTFMFWMLFFVDFAFRITDWTCCHGPHLHAILRIISRGVSGLATDSHCGAWGRGWTTCLLHDSPFFDSHFKMRVSMYVWSDISYIYYSLPLFTVSCMKSMIFYSVITFSYTKCFVHSYTVDVVFTLSYPISFC